MTKAIPEIRRASQGVANPGPARPRPTHLLRMGLGSPTSFRGRGFRERFAMPRVITIASAAMAAGLVAACAAGTVQTSSYVEPTYQWVNFTTYHQNRDTLVEVHGNPFGLDQSAFGEAVTAHMQGATVGPPTRFTTSPSGNMEKNMRVVMAFNVKPVGSSLCKLTSTEPAYNGAGTVVYAAWCWEDRMDSYVRASAGQISGVDDPRFRDLVAQTTMDLFPLYGDKEYNEDDNDHDMPN